MPPGKNAKHDRAGALKRTPGEGLPCLGPRTTPGLLRALLPRWAHTSPAPCVPRLSVVGEQEGRHKAPAVEPGWTSPPRLTLLWFPTYGPRATPSERAVGEGHDQGPRNHKRKRFREGSGDVERPLRQNGPGGYKLSRVEEAPEVTTAVAGLAAEAQETIAA
jgi:hypothetical protein